MTWKEWVKEVKRIIIEDYSYDANAVNKLTLEHFRPYFNEGLTPAEAVFNDIHGGSECRKK